MFQLLHFTKCHVRLYKWQSTFQHLLPILNDNPDPDYIPAPVAFSAAVPDDGSNTDQTFRNLLSDASRVLLAGDNLPPPPSSLTQYPATAAFISYFESNWLNNPHYPLKMWNCYDATLSDDPKTNNVSEGSNNALNTAAGCSSPTIYRFIDIIQGFNSEAELKNLQSYKHKLLLVKRRAESPEIRQSKWKKEWGKLLRVTVLKTLLHTADHLDT